MQAKLDEDARKKAEADALRRLLPVTQPTLPKPSANLPKITTPTPKPTPRFTAPSTPAPAPAVDRAFQRGTPEYYARINEVLQGRTQGVAPGYGSTSAPNQPAQRTNPKPPELTEMLGPNGGGFGSVAEPPRPVTQQPPRQPRPAGPPPLSPEAEEALFASALAQDDRAARNEGPSVFSGLRAAENERLRNEQIWEQGLAGEVTGSIESESAYQRALNRLRSDETSLQEELAERILLPGSEPDDADGFNPLTWAAKSGLSLGRQGIGLGIDGARKGIELGLDVADPIVDFELDRLGDFLELAEPLDTGLINPALGDAIAATTDCPDVRVVPPIRPGGKPVVIHENCGDAPVFNVIGKRPFTVGNHVFSQIPLEEFDEWEERYHAAQYEEAGDLFIPRYLTDLWAQGYDRNPYELEAKAFAAAQVAGDLGAERVEMSEWSAPWTAADGPGAALFALTPDEEAMYASPSTEAYIPERLIESYNQSELSKSDLDFIEGFSEEAQQLASLIAYLEGTGRIGDSQRAERLRSGG